MHKHYLKEINDEKHLMINMSSPVSMFCASSIFFVTILASYANAGNDTNLSSTNMSMMQMMERGNIAMGFNQNKIAHQFVETPSGGKITITALNDSDIQTINQIKNHTIDIRKDFSEGNFTGPFFIHAQEVPGTKLMTEKKNLIKYDITEMKNGSALLLTTNDTQLISAVHRFITFQSAQHRGH